MLTNSLRRATSTRVVVGYRSVTTACGVRTSRAKAYLTIGNNRGWHMFTT